MASDSFFARLSSDEKRSLLDVTNSVLDAERQRRLSKKCQQSDDRVSQLLYSVTDRELDLLIQLRGLCDQADRTSGHTAIALYQQASSLAPWDEVALMSIGVEYAGLKEYAQAIHWLEKALALNPQNERVRSNLQSVKVASSGGRGSVERALPGERGGGYDPKPIRPPTEKGVAAASVSGGSKTCLALFVLGGGFEPGYEKVALAEQFIKSNTAAIDFRGFAIHTGSVGRWGKRSEIDSCVITFLMQWFLRQGLQFDAKNLQFNDYYDDSTGKGYIVAAWILARDDDQLSGDHRPENGSASPPGEKPFAHRMVEYVMFVLLIGGLLAIGIGAILARFSNPPLSDLPTIAAKLQTPAGILILPGFASILLGLAVMVVFLWSKSSRSAISKETAPSPVSRPAQTARKS